MERTVFYHAADKQARKNFINEMITCLILTYIWQLAQECQHAIIPHLTYVNLDLAYEIRNTF